MKTDDLIHMLAEGEAATPPGMVKRRIWIALWVGFAAAALFVALRLHFRPMDVLMHDRSFGMKAAYTAALAVIGLWTVRRMARPGMEAALPWVPLAAVLLGIGGMSWMQMMGADPVDWQAMMLGRSWRLCPVWIVLSAVPTYAALIWALREAAPTRPAAAGAVAGFMAGAVGATAYGLHCPEAAAPFIAVWYTLGIAVSAGLGAIGGRFLLRW